MVSSRENLLQQLSVGALSTDENERPQFKISKGNQLYCAIP